MCKLQIINTQCSTPNCKTYFPPFTKLIKACNCGLPLKCQDITWEPEGQIHGQCFYCIPHEQQHTFLSNTMRQQGESQTIPEQFMHLHRQLQGQAYAAAHSLAWSPTEGLRVQDISRVPDHLRLPSYPAQPTATASHLPATPAGNPFERDMSATPYVRQYPNLTLQHGSPRTPRVPYQGYDDSVREMTRGRERHPSGDNNALVRYGEEERLGDARESQSSSSSRRHRRSGHSHR